MRDQNDSVVARETDDLVEWLEDLDVGIEICNLVPAAAEERPEEPRFHRGRELREVVDHPHASYLGTLDPDVEGGNTSKRSPDAIG